MASPALTILIPTCRRSQLLRRTLESLASCVLPAHLRQVIVVENGPALGAQDTVRRFRGRLPIVYRHIRDASKSIALNQGLNMCRGDFVVFLDDDVRVHAATLSAYANAVAGRNHGIFIGGRCLVDYEAVPPPWLMPYLPLSAKGWSLGESILPLSAPHALGFNWGAFASEVLLAGGFDTAHGPGRSIPIGEETRLQAELLAMGVAGWYVPAATVWHYVPRHRCSTAWALQRAELMGYCAGETRRASLAMVRLARVAGCRLRIAAFSTALRLLGTRLAAPRRFHFAHQRAWRTGFARGLREGAHSATKQPRSPDITKPARARVVPVAGARP